MAATTVSEVRTLVEEAALGADVVLEVALPRFAKAAEWDDLTRFVSSVEAEVGYGTARSLVRLFAEPFGAPCSDVTDLGGLLQIIDRSQVPANAEVVVVVEGEPDDRCDGEWSVVSIGASRRFGSGQVPTLRFHLEM